VCVFKKVSLFVGFTMFIHVQVVSRHIVRGQQMDYASLVDGAFTHLARDRNITVHMWTDGS